MNQSIIFYCFFLLIMDQITEKQSINIHYFYYTTFAVLLCIARTTFYNMPLALFLTEFVAFELYYPKEASLNAWIVPIGYPKRWTIYYVVLFWSQVLWYYRAWGITGVVCTGAVSYISELPTKWSSLATSFVMMYALGLIE